LIVARGDLLEARGVRALPVAGLSSLQVVAELLKAPPDATRRRRAGAADVKARAGGEIGRESSRPGRPSAEANGRQSMPVRAESTNGARGP
jgi:hypothetical protein